MESKAAKSQKRRLATEFVGPVRASASLSDIITVRMVIFIENSPMSIKMIFAAHCATTLSLEKLLRPMVHCSEDGGSTEVSDLNVFIAESLQELEKSFSLNDSL